MAEEQKEQPLPPQAAPASLPGAPMRTNAMAEIIAEDHLRAMLNKSSNQGVYKPYVTKLLQRPNHSPFGDFPKDFLKKETKKEDFSIDIYEKSQAASASSMAIC